MKTFALKRLPIVTAEIFEAGEWSEEQNPGAGLPEGFDEEVASVMDELRTAALFHRIRFRDVRRAPLERFGFYGVCYVVRGDAVIVIAVFHDRRDRRRLRGRRREVGGKL